MVLCSEIKFHCFMKATSPHPACGCCKLTSATTMWSAGAVSTTDAKAKSWFVVDEIMVLQKHKDLDKALLFRINTRMHKWQEKHSFLTEYWMLQKELLPSNCENIREQRQVLHHRAWKLKMKAGIRTRASKTLIVSVVSEQWWRTFACQRVTLNCAVGGPTCCATAVKN